MKNVNIVKIYASEMEELYIQKGRVEALRAYLQTKEFIDAKEMLAILGMDKKVEEGERQ